MEVLVAETILRLLDAAKPEPSNAALAAAERAALGRGPVQDPDDPRARALATIREARSGADRGHQQAAEMLHHAKIAVLIWLNARKNQSR